MHRLPPLHDLLAFEAAARHMSFLKASDELHVTQSAVSHRIKSLEEFLGVALFIRVNRNIALTSFGERYLAEVKSALAVLDAATTNLKGSTRARLRISAASALGAKWLVACLAGFQCAHPEVELAVSSSYDLELLLMYEAATAGQGVALTLKTLFEGYGANGILVKPYALEIWDCAYTIVLAPEAVHKPAVTLFTDWLRAEAGAASG